MTCLPHSDLSIKLDTKVSIKTKTKTKTFQNLNKNCPLLSLCSCAMYLVKTLIILTESYNLRVLTEPSRAMQPKGTQDQWDPKICKTGWVFYRGPRLKAWTINSPVPLDCNA